MIKAESKKMLQDERVINEVNRHKWLESEKAGYDIGFDKAAEDWMNRFSQSWLKNNSGASSATGAAREAATKKSATSRLKK
jgi:hypothetical protein